MSIEAMPKPVYDWFTRKSIDLAWVLFGHHEPITVCAYVYRSQYLNESKCAVFWVTALDLLLSKDHCQRAYRNYLTGRTYEYENDVY